MSHKTLVLGLEHFIDKIAYQSCAYKKNNICVRYFLLDATGYSGYKAKEFNADIAIASHNVLLRIFQTILEFIRFKPHWVELYDTGRLTIIYAILTRIFGCKLLIILRGLELEHVKKNDIRGQCLRIALMRLSSHIIAKEYNIINDLKMIGVKMDKVSHIHNGIVPSKNPDNGNREIDILYLNSVRRERNVDLLIDAINELKKERIPLKVVITGFTSFGENTYKMDVEYEVKILNQIKDLDLTDIIQVEGFVRDTERFFTRAKIFVLPADVIFLNHSLLEAMNYEVAPLVVNGEGANKIIDDGIDGIIVAKSSEGIKNGIKEMLNKNRYKIFGKKARQKVLHGFTMDCWVEKMLEVRKKIKK